MSPQVPGSAVSLPPKGAIAPLELFCERQHA